MHDAKVFSNSSICCKLRDGELPIVYQNLIAGRNRVGNYLLADPAYPLTPFCLKEYDSCESDAKVVFNNLLRSARNPIECAFGRLKARWRVLTKPIDLKLEFVPTMIYTCFVLHNICEENKTYVDGELVKAQYEYHVENENNFQNTPHTIYSANLDEGYAVRDLINSYVEANLVMDSNGNVW